MWINEFNEQKYESELMKININELDNSKIIIAEHRGDIVGRCDISIQFSLYDFEKTGYVDWLYVLKEKREKGIGKKLLEGAEKYFKEIGVDRYYLFTAENEQAQSFYHKQDFRFTKREVAEKKLT
ncbi:MAG: GNAT family N-acetyltransferase [Firmicutes bacterium]|nr:GNAT family N-acetyltransferase [Bacillota bacterium]